MSASPRNVIQRGKSAFLPTYFDTISVNLRGALWPPREPSGRPCEDRASAIRDETGLYVLFIDGRDGRFIWSDIKVSLFRTRSSENVDRLWSSGASYQTGKPLCLNVERHPAGPSDLGPSAGPSDLGLQAELGSDLSLGFRSGVCFSSRTGADDQSNSRICSTFRRSKKKGVDPRGFLLFFFHPFL